MTSNRLLPFLAAAVTALTPAAALAGGEGPIQDNSFLIEEAYNQEPGVIQHISTFTRAAGTGSWAYSYTEEWPVLGQTHQASITLNYAGLGETGTTGVGDLALNYRFQAYGNGDTRIALSPRLTILLPTGDAGQGLGSGGAGLQVNVPLSVVLSEGLVTHLNVGGTFIPSARASDGRYGPLSTFAAGQSVVWLAHPNFNVLTEVLYTNSALAGPSGLERTQTLTVNPGIRAALNFASGLQIVPGISFPIGVGPSQGDRGVFFYLSFEHPFTPAGPTVEVASKPSAGERG